MTNMLIVATPVLIIAAGATYWAWRVSRASLKNHKH